MSDNTINPENYKIVFVWVKCIDGGIIYTTALYEKGGKDVNNDTYYITRPIQIMIDDESKLSAFKWIPNSTEDEVVTLKKSSVVSIGTLNEDGIEFYKSVIKTMNALKEEGVSADTGVFTPAKSKEDIETFKKLIDDTNNNVNNINSDYTKFSNDRWDFLN